MFEFRLPDVGEGVAEGEIVRWLVSVGDAVSEDEPLAEVETDKALVEIPSPVDGTVAELRAAEGEVVPVGDVFVVIDDGEGEPTEAVEGTADADAATTPDASADAGGTGRTFAPPHVRRLAREQGVDLDAVTGTGPGGRVTESDVRAATDQADLEAPDRDHEPEPAPAPSTTGDGTARSAASRGRTLATPATRRVARDLDLDLDAVPATEDRDGEAFVTAEAVRAYAGSGGAPEPAAAPGERAEERIPYRGVRRTIGQQMERSKYTAPHVTHFDEADAEPLVEAREQLKPRAEDRGIRLTYLPFLMKIASRALEATPTLNASLDEDAEEIVVKRYHNIGFATAAEQGLLVPVIDDVDRKGLLEIAARVDELAASARDRSISRDEMQGGTFTITNVGAVGGTFGTPIINHPEVAILALGAIEPRPWVVDGEVVARRTLPLSLSFDHRVNDGATVAEFVNRVVEYVENPYLLIE